MDFSFTEEQNAIVKMVRDFTKNEILPKYAQWDRTSKFPHELYKKVADLGLIGMASDPKYGGGGMDCVTAGLVAEELGKGDPGFAISVSVVGEFISYLIETGGTEKVKKEWIPLIAQGKQIPTMVITEPHCGTDAAAIRSRAIRKGDTYVLSGEKSGGTLVMDADFAVIFAKTDPDAGARGVSAFIVPMDLPGVTRQSYEDLGLRNAVRGSIFLDDVEIPAEYLLGEEGGGFKLIMKTFDFSRTLLGLICLGSAQATIEDTVRYTKERYAFGMPLGKFEGVSFPVVEHYSKIEAVRWLSYHALWLRDQGLPHSAEAGMCKWLGPKVSTDAIHDCLLLHGHYGYTNEFPIEQRLRDVIGIEIADGTAQVSKIVIVRELFGRECLPY